MAPSTLCFQDFKPSHRLLQVPELIRMICGFSEREHYVKLLYVSRRTYTYVLPMVWEETNLQSVLLLIPGAKIVGEDEGHPEYECAIQFPSVIDPTRFDVHSHLVKTVRTLRIQFVEFPDQWPGRGSREAPSPLLPNLQRLVINTCYPLKQAGWMFKLLNPSLLDLLIAPIDAENESELEGLFEEPPGPDVQICSDLLDHVLHTCPHLVRLCLYPLESGGTNQTQRYSLYAKLAKLTHLRFFSFVVSEVYGDIFPVLGQLPCLESLSLISSGISMSSCKSIAMPDDSFPCLQRLSLHDLCDSAVDFICKIAPLFRHLVTAKIVFCIQCYEESGGDHVRSTMLFRSMGQNSPHLRNLSVHSGGHFGQFAVNSSIINKLNYEEDDIARSDSPEAQWTAFLTAVPNLEELELTEQDLPPGHLRLFASLLPNLQRLVLPRIWLDDVNGTFGDVNAPQSIAIRSGAFFRSQSSPRFGRTPDEPSIANAAKYLHGLWPNVVCERLTGDPLVTRLREMLESLKC
ncbi:hypothetical protein FRC12_010422 [Ceratobasidium sp. 428]|nr:hypothetical protein FRC12_010422 [Ceratobasidium sp. 428]